MTTNTTTGPAWVMLGRHWMLPDTGVPHIATPGEHWPVPSDIAVCGAQMVGIERQRVGVPDAACQACRDALAAHPGRAYVAQGPRPMRVAWTINVAGADGRAGTVHRAQEDDPTHVGDFTPICPTGRKAVEHRGMSYQRTDRIVNCRGCLDILAGAA